MKRLSKRGKAGNVIKIGPPPGLYDDFTYDECLEERRYCNSQVDATLKALDKTSALDPRGACCGEMGNIENELAGYKAAMERMIEMVEHRMVLLTKKEFGTEVHTDSETKGKPK